MFPTDYSLPLHPTPYTLHAIKSPDSRKKLTFLQFPFVISKRSCNFAGRSPTLGLGGGKCPLSESQNCLTKSPVVAFKTF